MIAEQHVTPIFGPIQVEEMSRNPQLARLVLKVVADACKHTKGRYSAESIAKGLASGAFRVWGVLTPPDKLEAAIVTRAEGQVFELIVQGPRIDDVLPFLAVLEKEARKSGCDRLQLTGPQFFRQILPEGWKAREVRFERLLSVAS